MWQKYVRRVQRTLGSEVRDALQNIPNSVSRFSLVYLGTRAYAIRPYIIHHTDEVNK